MTSPEKVRQEAGSSRTGRSNWLEFTREARYSFESFAREQYPIALDKSRIVRGRLLAKAMILRLSPARRVWFFFAVALLFSSLFVPIEPAPRLAIARIFISALFLLVLLILELADRASLKRELEFARDVQQWLLLRDPPQIPGIDIAFSTRAAKTVGGDYYEATALPAGQGASPALRLVVADIAGKGIPASLLMAGFRACLRTLAVDNQSLSDLARRIHGFCCADSDRGRHFTTAFIAQYDIDSHSLFYVNAGHNPPLLRRSSGQIEQIEANGLPLGAFVDAAYTVDRLSVEPGDLLLLYTDGVVEAVNEKGEEYGLERLCDFVRTPARASVEYQRRLFVEIDAFAGSAPQRDDITCMFVQFTSSQTRQYTD